ncbi:MAG: cation:proton antiporter [Clostridia bacterium]|nr:cation:proton antiporter [Clostridia bacterium]
MGDYTILLELALILLFTKLFGIVVKKIGLPQVVGFLIAGLLLGPCVLGWVHPSETLKIIAELGVILIMFSAGLETNVEDLKKCGLAALLVAAAGVALPLVFGFLLAAAFHGGFSGVDTEQILRYVFVGVVMTATSVSITVETLRELGKLKSRAGTVILSAAIIDDVIGIVLLSVVIGFKNPDVKPLEAILKTVGFFAAAVAVGIGIHFLFKWLNKKFPHTRRLPILGLVVCFLYAYCAERFFGVADITGAYLAGIMMSGLKETEYIDRKVEINAYMFFAPVFFAGIGINASFAGFNANTVWFMLAFVSVAILTKALGCFSAAKVLRYGWGESLVVGVGMIARGEVCLIVLQKGIAAGLIEPDYLAMGVLLVIVSSFLAPVLLKFIYRKSDVSRPPHTLGDPKEDLLPNVDSSPLDKG